MEQFRYKEPSELEEQVRATESILGKELPQSSSREDTSGMSVEKLKEKYPRRYGIYLQTLRSQRSGEPISLEEIGSMREWLRRLNNLDAYIGEHKAFENKRTLREEQINVFEAMRDYLENGGNEGYVKLPTGAGKTVLFTEFLEAIGVKTVIAVPTLTLVDQTIKKLERFAPGVKVGKVSGTAKEFGKNVTVVTYASLVNEIERKNIKPEEIGLLILDEAHRSLSDLRTGSVSKFTNAIKLGFTATPIFSEDKEVRNLLNTEIYSMSIPEAVEECLLSSFSVTLARTDVDISKVKISGTDYSEKELEQAINIQSRNMAAVKLYKDAFDKKLGIAFCAGIEHAKRVSKLFNESNVPSAVITGQTDSEESAKILERYERGEIKVLCTADKLIEGFDEPRASVCLNLRPTLSRVIAEQRAGRVLRLDEDNPDKFAHIVEFLDRKTNEDTPGPITFAEIVGSPGIIRKSDRPYADREEIRDITRQSEQAGTARLTGIQIEGLQIITDTQEIFRIVSETRESRGRAMPLPGWMTLESLKRELGVSKKPILKIVDAKRVTNPEWFGTFQIHTGRKIEHFSPPLVDLIKKEVLSLEDAPLGWETRKGLADRIGSNFTTVDRATDAHREFHPEWFREYRGRNGSRAEHLSPELIRLLEEKQKNAIEAPVGWITRNKLAEKMGRSALGLKNKVEQHRKDHPEWFRTSHDAMGRLFEHISPQLIKTIEQEDKEIKIAPAEWQPTQVLAKSLGVSDKVVSRIASSYREKNPEWFKVMRYEKSRPFEFLSPRLIRIITEEVSSMEPAPVGWKTAGEIQRETAVSKTLINTIAGEFLALEPGMSFDYKAPGGQTAKHFAPELVDLIKEEIDKRKRR